MLASPTGWTLGGVLGAKGICCFDAFFTGLPEEDAALQARMGTVVPKMGTTVHLEDGGDRYRAAIAVALRSELGPTHQAIKTAMRWTGASERTVEHWFSGDRGPSGAHLILLAQHSDAVLVVILTMAERLSDNRQRWAGCPDRLLVLQNLGHKMLVSDDL